MWSVNDSVCCKGIWDGLQGKVNNTLEHLNMLILHLGHENEMFYHTVLQHFKNDRRSHVILIVQAKG